LASTIQRPQARQLAVPKKHSLIEFFLHYQEAECDDLTRVAPNLRYVYLRPMRDDTHCGRYQSALFKVG
jgi:hypothetical protein